MLGFEPQPEEAVTAVDPEVILPERFCFIVYLSLLHVHVNGLRDFYR